MRIFLIGYMGSGKTTLGKSLAGLLGYRCIDLDEDIEIRYKISIPDLFSRYGEAPFRQIEQRLLHEYLEYEDVVISTGGGTACYSDNMELMLKHGIVVYLEMSPQELADRLTFSARKRPLLMMKLGEELTNHISGHLSQRELYYMKAHITLSGINPDPNSIAGEIRRHALFIP